MNPEEVGQLVKLLEEKNNRLQERERELEERSEELMAQKEELTAAIEELIGKNESLNATLAKLQERNFELDQILYRTSHDLRSPVTSMKGIMMLMKADQLTASSQEYSRHLETRIQQMDGLLNSLTTLARVMSDPLQVSSITVAHLLQEVISLSDADHPDAPADIQLRIQVDSVSSDLGLLTAMLLELFNNARTFTANGKASVDVIWKSTATEWYLEVKDDGEGMPVEVQPKIFDMFYRGSERSKGNGLGLYIVRKALERLDGRIDFVSKPGETRFMIYLPHQPGAK